MKITPEIARGAYEFLHTIPPFNGWNLPDGEDIKFKIIKSHMTSGEYRHYGGDDHEIAVYKDMMPPALLGVVAHEMIHLHQRMTKTDGGGAHNRSFKILASKITKILGVDV